MRWRTFFLLLITLLVAAAVRAEVRLLSLAENRTRLDLVAQSSGELSFRIILGELHAREVVTAAGPFTQLTLPGYQISRAVGEPALPLLNRLIAVPFGAAARVEVEGTTTRLIDLADHGLEAPLLPAQPSLPKNADPASWPFAYDAESYSSAEVSRELVTVVPLGRLRGLDLARLQISPVVYYPLENRLRVTESITFRIVFDGADKAAGSDLLARTHSPFFLPLYDRVANAKSVHDDYPDLVRDVVTMVVITPPEFTAQLAEFVDWKTARGFRVVVGITGSPEVGSTAASIQSYIHALYNSGTPELPAPSFVLLVGDVEQIPVFTEESNPSDRPYCAVDGDVIPDIYYGRFPAGNSSQLQAMLDKTLLYDQFALPDPSYLGEVVMIAGMDGSHGADWANGQINYGTDNYFDASHGITSHTYLYPSSGGHAADIVQDVSNGVVYVNYTAHGSAFGWSNPQFLQADINGLDNYGRYCLAVGNCCSSASFDIGECFGETWLRAPDKGAIGYIGGSGLTYWDEDYWWAVGHTAAITSNPTYETSGLGVYDGLFHDHGEPADQWYVTNDALVFCGNLAVLESGSDLGDYYWSIYHLLGDPSLSLYLGEPATNLVSHPDSVLMTTTKLTITAAPGSYVGLSQNGVLLGGGSVDGSGSLVMTLLQKPLTPWVPLRLVVMAQNIEPYHADITVTVPVSVELTPSQIPVNLSTDVFVTVRGADGVTPQVGIDVWAEGLRYATDPVATDESGLAVITVTAPYGPGINIVGQDPALDYRQFTRPVGVDAPGLPVADLSVTTEVGLADTFALDWPGILRATVSEPAVTLYAFLPDGSELFASQDSLQITPRSLGQVTGTIAVTGYDLYSEDFPVIRLTAGGVLVIDDTGGGKQPSELVSDLEGLGYGITVQPAAQSPAALWPDYDLLVLHCGDNPEALAEPALRDALVAYAGVGRRLLIESGELGRLYHDSDPDFAAGVLHIAEWVGDLGGHILVTEPTHHVMSVPNTVNIVPTDLAVDEQDHDVVLPGPDAVMVARWSDYASAAGIIAYDNTPLPEGGQIVYLPFAYAVMHPAERLKLLENSLRWLTSSDVIFGSVSGTVTLAGETDHGGVLITAPPCGDSVLTGTDGSYTLSSLSPATYQVTASRDGWTTGQQEVTLSPGQHETGVDFLLTPETQNSVAGPVAATATVDGISLSWDYDPLELDGCHLYRRQGTESAIRLTVEPLIGTAGHITYLDPGYGLIPGTILHYSFGLVRAGEEIGRGSEVTITFAGQAPAAFALYPSYPNPFNPQTSITFALPRPGHATLRVYDASGRLVRTLLDAPLPAARHRRRWDGTDDSGRRVASGVYYARLVSPYAASVVKMLLIK